MEITYDASTNLFCGNQQISNDLEQVIWHITNLCHLNCAMCFTKKMREKLEPLPYSEIIEQVGLLKQLGVKKIDFSGGEPLLYPLLHQLIPLCKQEGFSMTLTTSGFGQRQNITWVVDNWKVFSRIILSLDGGERVHNCLRGSTNAFSSLRTFQKLLTKEKCENVRINTIVNKLILHKHEMESICNLVLELNPLEWCLIEPYPINHTEEFDKYTVSKEEFSNFIQNCKETVASSEIKIIQRTNADYAAYWSLFHDGYLYYTNDCKTYDIKMELTATNIKKIKEEILQHAQTYILPKHDHFIKNSI